MGTLWERDGLLLTNEAGTQLLECDVCPCGPETVPCGVCLADPPRWFTITAAGITGCCADWNGEHAVEYAWSFPDLCYWKDEQTVCGQSQLLEITIQKVVGISISINYSYWDGSLWVSMAHYFLTIMGLDQIDCWDQYEIPLVSSSGDCTWPAFVRLS